MSGELPSVTIVVPAFNHERYLKIALDSMLGSGVPDLEIVVCDDASPDCTADVAEAWGAEHAHELRRFKLIRHAFNQGLCTSMNDLMREATGDLIQIIGSDDYFLPGGILAKTKAMMDHPEWGVAFCDGCAVGPEGEMYLPSIVAASRFIISQLKPDSMGEELLFHWSPPVHQMTWRRSLFKAHGGEYEYDPTVFCEDYDSAIWAASRNLLGFIPQVCQAYRYRSWPQTTNRNVLREYRDNAHVQAKYARNFPPSVRRGFELLSETHFKMAIGDTISVPQMWSQFHALEAAYRQRVESGEPAPQEEEIAERDSLRDALVQANAQIASLREKLDAAKAQGKVRKEELSDLKDQYAALRSQMRHHAANPLRALALWWKRKRLAK